MEDFNFKTYRKGVADDLKDLRSKGAPELAKVFLQLTQNLNRYQLAKEKSKEERKLKNPKENKNVGVEDTHSLVKETIEVIEKKEGLDFIVGIIGNLSMESKKTDNRFNVAGGYKQFYFNRNRNQISQTPDINNDLYQNLDSLFSREEILHEKLFQAHFKVLNAFYYQFEKKIERPFQIVAIRIPFKPQDLNNNFCKDVRAGVHLTFALQYPNQIQNMDFLNKEIKGYLENPNTNEASSFFLELFIQCGKKYIPEYLEFFFEQKRLYDENNK